jgi:hypothetical protein
MSRAEWFALPNKFQQGQRPVSYYLERTRQPVIYFWQTPQTCDYRCKYYRLRSSMDVGRLTDNPEVAQRWNDAIAAGAAARLATKYAPERLEFLGTQADQAYQTAAEEDVEHVTFRINPDFSGYYN